MNWIDLLIAGILVLSLLISLWRGFIREIISLITWVAAFWVAIKMSPSGAKWVESFSFIESEVLGYALSFILIFILVMSVGALLSWFTKKALSQSDLSIENRIFGGLFGILRGVVVVTLFVFAANWTKLPEEKTWKKALLVPPFEQLAQMLGHYIPENIPEDMPKDLSKEITKNLT